MYQVNFNVSLNVAGVSLEETHNNAINEILSKIGFNSIKWIGTKKLPITEENYKKLLKKMKKNGLTTKRLVDIANKNNIFDVEDLEFVGDEGRSNTKDNKERPD